MLDLAAESRYDQYDLFIDKPTPLVPRGRCASPCRSGSTVHGNVLASRSTRPQCRRSHRRCGAARVVESVVFAFLHSYANPEHEQRAAAVLPRRGQMPALWVTLSCEVCPELRDRARLDGGRQRLCAAADGWIPRAGMADALAAEQFRGAIYLVTSGGGLTSLETARRFPVRLVENSGPAGGAIFAGPYGHASRPGQSGLVRHGRHHRQDLPD